jgi:hypothetical protein
MGTFKDIAQLETAFIRERLHLEKNGIKFRHKSTTSIPTIF